MREPSQMTEQRSLKQAIKRGEAEAEPSEHTDSRGKLSEGGPNQPVPDQRSGGSRPWSRREAEEEARVLGERKQNHPDKQDEMDEAPSGTDTEILAISAEVQDC